MQKEGKTMSMTRTAHKMLDRLRVFWRYMNAGPEQDWERVYLCSMAPMSAGALRRNEEAEHSHNPW